MKQQISEKIKVPEGITVKYQDSFLTLSNGSSELSGKFSASKIGIKLEGNDLIIFCLKASKNEKKIINSFIAHIKNMFVGLNEPYVYKLEVCNVHFPITLKVEKDKIAIINFLGEKTSRYAKILSNVDVQIKGNQIPVTSNDIASAGQTAANLEKATKIKDHDRRIFQDGIFITQKPGEKNK